MYLVITNRLHYVYQPYQQLLQPHQLPFTPVSNLMLCCSTQLAFISVPNPMLYCPTQLAPTPVSNTGLYCFNFNIWDDCKCISMHLMAPVSLTQVFPMQLSPTQAVPLQAPLIQALPLQALLIQRQPATTWISNPAPPTSKFWKDCKCIPDHLTGLTLSTQALLIQIPMPQPAPIQVSPATKSPI